MKLISLLFMLLALPAMAQFSYSAQGMKYKHKIIPLKKVDLPGLKRVLGDSQSMDLGTHVVEKYPKLGIHLLRKKGDKKHLQITHTLTKTSNRAAKAYEGKVAVNGVFINRKWSIDELAKQTKAERVEETQSGLSTDNAHILHYKGYSIKFLHGKDSKLINSMSLQGL